jgi:hypothetical protein
MTAASRFGVEGWMESLRFDVEPFGSHTTMVETGFFRTELLVEGSSTIWPELSIDDCADRTRSTIDAWRGMNGQQGGDPAKLAAMVVPGAVVIGGTDRFSSVVEMRSLTTAAKCTSSRCPRRSRRPGCSPARPDRMYQPCTTPRVNSGQQQGTAGPCRPDLRRAKYLPTRKNASTWLRAHNPKVVGCAPAGGQGRPRGRLTQGAVVRARTATHPVGTSAAHPGDPGAVGASAKRVREKSAAPTDSGRLNGQRHTRKAMLRGH